jgi:dTDP-4-dehydrorhamnose reductase
VQKSKVEEFILERFENYLIFRLAKIYGESKTDNAILNQFVGGYLGSEVHICAYDQWFSPTWQPDLIAVLDHALSKDLNGLYHLSSGLRYSRWELYCQFARQAGLYLKAKCGSLKHLPTLESLPHDVSLSNDRLSERINFRFTNVAEGIDSYLKQNGESMRETIPTQYWKA